MIEHYAVTDIGMGSVLKLSVPDKRLTLIIKKSPMVAKIIEIDNIDVDALLRGEDLKI